jgi:hypothetical protein
MSIEVLKTKAEQGLADQFTAGKSGLPGAGNAWAEGLRDAAWESYASAGLPHRRIEEWKYTDLRALLRDAYPPAPALAEALTGDDISAALDSALAGLDCHRLVILDGQFRPELSDVSGLEGQGEVISLSEALADPSDLLKKTLAQINPPKCDAVIALNTALMTGGIVLRIEDNAERGIRKTGSHCSPVCRQGSREHHHPQCRLRRRWRQGNPAGELCISWKRSGAAQRGDGTCCGRWVRSASHQIPEREY